MVDIPSVTPDFQFDVSGGDIVGIFYLFYYLLTSGVSIASYVLLSLGLYGMAKRRGIHNPWLAWLPLGNLWILGSISDQYQYVVKGKVKNKRKTLLILNILMYAVILAVVVIAAVLIVQGIGDASDLNMNSLAATMISGILLLVGLWVAMAASGVALAVLQYIALYDLYRSSEPNNSVLYLLLSIFVSITMPILVFLCRNKELGMPPRRQETAFIPQQPADVPQWQPVQNTADPWDNPKE